MKYTLTELYNIATKAKAGLYNTRNAEQFTEAVAKFTAVVAYYYHLGGKKVIASEENAKSEGNKLIVRHIDILCDFYATYADVRNYLRKSVNLSTAEKVKHIINMSKKYPTYIKEDLSKRKFLTDFECLSNIYTAYVEYANTDPQLCWTLHHAYLLVEG